jgi:hypothetical protein
MSRQRRSIAALAVIAMGALIGACGSNGTADTGGAGTSTRAQAGVTFSRCMRSHGVSNFPDPGESGKFTIDEVANGSSVDTSTPAFTHALSACKSLEPAGFTGGRRSSAQQSAALKFAACIRANGVKDFPDPVNGQPLVDTNRIPSSAEPGGMDILHTAMRKCADFGAAAGVQR